MFDLLPNAIRALIATYLPASTPPTTSNSLSFTLRHLHAVHNSTRTVFADMPPSFAASAHVLGIHPVSVHRPASQGAFHSARRMRGAEAVSALQWDEDEVLGPNVSSRATLLELAKMTNNAYTEPGKKDWYDLGSDWDVGYPFGWEPDSDGFRGHVFVSEDNSTVVVSIKGTSAGWMVGGGGPTVSKDRLNDNLLFSCCCARVGPTWSTVCGCYSGSYKCDQTCLENSLIEESLFYSVGINLYNNITYMYPDANIWLTGHSLGGALAGLMGATFGTPTVAFEAPGEKLAAARLHLPSPPSVKHITHVYHTADPIAMGTCTGVASSCALGGYAMESRCHLGRVRRYDTVGTLGWAVDIRTHGIKVVIDRILNADWDEGADDEKGKGKGKDSGKKEKKGNGEVPEWYDESDCVDCYNWEFGQFKNASLTARGSCSGVLP